jgi:PAS domain S-box-containing protein
VRSLKSVRIAALVSLLSLGLASKAGLAAPTPTSVPKRVMLLHEGVVGFSPVRDRFDAAFIRAIRSAPSAQIEVYEETFETVRFPAPEQFPLVRDFLTSKYAGRKIDVIVTLGIGPLALARQAREMLGNPAIVATLPPTGRIDRTDNVTGLQGGIFINATIDLALTLQPDTRSVLVVDGGFEGNEDLRGEVERQIKARSHHVDLAYLKDLPMNDVVSRVATAPDHSIVLFIKQNIRTRTQPLAPFDALAEVVSASRVPVFSQMEEYVGLGIVGGYVWDFEVDARRMAEMAVQLAAGASARDVPSGRNTYKTVLDWRQLQRWGIPPSRVPAGSVVLFRPQSFFELYRRYVLGGAFVFSVQFALIIALLVQRGRRRRAEEESRSNANRYRNVVDTQSELICRFLPDTTLTFVNDAYCRFWNTTRERLLGTKFIELVPPPDREAVLDRIGRLHLGMDSHEHPVLLPGGGTGWQHWTNHAILDDCGRVIELQAVGRDLTDLRRAEEAVGMLEMRNSAVLRAIPDVMFVLLRNGTFVSAHAKDPTLLFAPPNTFLGKSVRDVMPPHLADLFMDAITRACAGGDTIVVEYDLQIGNAQHFEARFVQAAPDRVLSMVRDVTESKHALERNRDLAGRLIASQEVERQRIARELHDDVSQKIALLNIEIDQVAGRMGSDESRSRMQEISSHVGQIATDLHNLSRELHPSKLHMLGLFAAVQSLCRDVSHQSGVRVTFTHGAAPPAVEPDISLCLYRIAQEALHNVARHSRAREAQVSMKCEDNRLELRIADSGVGFDANGGGRTGLGLISMHERVALLKGDFAIHTFPGGGTRILARVPLRSGSDISAAPVVFQSA